MGSQVSQIQSTFGRTTAPSKLRPPTIQTSYESKYKRQISLPQDMTTAQASYTGETDGSYKAYLLCSSGETVNHIPPMLVLTMYIQARCSSFVKSWTSSKACSRMSKFRLLLDRGCIFESPHAQVLCLPAPYLPSFPVSYRANSGCADYTNAARML